MHRAGIIVGWVFLFIGPIVQAGAEPPAMSMGPTVQAAHGMVVSVSAPASQVGCEMLRRGGSAVDAAVATAFALAVTYPEARNIGGGGFMLIHPGTRAAGEPVMIDYRETAPAAATREMFVDGKPSSYKLVGVPGTVRGLALAHEKYGKLPWKDLLLPAVKLAEDGFSIDAHLARSLNGVVRSSADFPELRRVFTRDQSDPEKRWQAGDRLVQPDLARTLLKIAEAGPDAFYTGDIARRLADEVKSGGGIVTVDDLAKYEAKIRPAVHGTFRGYDIYSSPPPSSGGIALVEMLNVLENFDLRAKGRWDPQTLHLMIETMRRAYRDRAYWLGDSDYVKMPAHLMGKGLAKQVAQKIDLTKATTSESLADEAHIPLAHEAGQTTHFSIIDEQGMAVANTYTLEQSYGGRIMVKGAGFLLNNEMGDFNPRPGITDRQGLIGTEPNQVAPGKRMLSSMTPTIVTRDGRVVLVTGSPGGRTIINTVLCVTLNVLEFGMPLREAVDAPRLHEPWFPDEVTVEPGFLNEHATGVDALKKLGHHFNPKSAVQGDAHSIAWDPASGAYIGVADKRISGEAAGY